MFKRIRRDIQVIFERDPAVKNWIEAVLCYPGLHAIWVHRIAHWFYKHRWYVVARIISQIARFFTGIEIHPGATIGEGLFIDHGAGVIIGETAEIGDNVTIYQGVTLGGTGKEKGKRHPTIGNNVMISAGAKILGSFTVGDYAKIGAGAVVLHPVPPNSTVVGVPGRVVVQDGVRVGHELDHADIPDPVAKMFECLQHKIMQLENRLAELEGAQTQDTTG
ncbi:MAG TPA: serine O-acetyltransferase [Firmicutes bacterium]|jgi:serine O-acetyltransferase|nr:serine O-acetyltransferase [Bacillota bacterium]HOQ23592.1 serine O-acetyltransferase [Bacillota bacterium]HPT67235.1 serine O-acetyltransferase [Bacillota bacterium]